MSNLIKGIHHVSLNCKGKTEFDKTISFYKEILKMDILKSWDTGVMLGSGNVMIEIFSDAEDVLPQGTIRHFALATDDTDACVKAVQEAGYEVVVLPKDISIPSTPVCNARIAFCIGPVGEEIEFFQEKKCIE